MAIDWLNKVVIPTVGVFGQDALYLPRDNTAPYAVYGVFDKAYQDVVILGAEDANTTDTKPVIGLSDDQQVGRTLWDQDDRLVTPVVVNGDGTVTIPVDAITYIVKESQPDHHGHTFLTLMITADYQP